MIEIREWLHKVQNTQPERGCVSFGDPVIRDIKLLEKKSGRQTAVDILNGARLSASKAFPSNLSWVASPSKDPATDNEAGDGDKALMDASAMVHFPRKPRVSIWTAGDQSRQLYFMILYIFLKRSKSGKHKSLHASGQVAMAVMKNSSFQIALMACAAELTMLGYSEYTGGSKPFPDSAVELVGMKGMLDLWEAIHWFAVLLSPDRVPHDKGNVLHSLLPPPVSIQTQLSFMRVCIEDAFGWQPGSGILDAMLEGGGGPLAKGNYSTIQHYLQSVFGQASTSMDAMLTHALQLEQGGVSNSSSSSETLHLMVPEFSEADETENTEPGSDPLMPIYAAEVEKCCMRLRKFYETKFKPVIEAIYFGGASSGVNVPRRQQKRTASQLAGSTGDALPFKLLRSQSRRSVLTPRNLNIEYKDQLAQQPQKTPSYSAHGILSPARTEVPNGELPIDSISGTPFSEVNKSQDDEESTISLATRRNNMGTDVPRAHIRRPPSTRRGRLSGMR